MRHHSHHSGWSCFFVVIVLFLSVFLTCCSPVVYLLFTCCLLVLTCCLLVVYLFSKQYDLPFTEAMMMMHTHKGTWFWSKKEEGDFTLSLVKQQQVKHGTDEPNFSSKKQNQILCCDGLIDELFPNNVVRALVETPKGTCFFSLTLYCYDNFNFGRAFILREQ